MSGTHVAEISRRLVRLQAVIPNIFVRKPRSVDEIDRWKATEFCQFLLYTRKIVLKQILRQDLYGHFLASCVVMCILVYSRLATNQRVYAQRWLDYLIAEGIHLYGCEFVVYNIHTTIHIASDVEEFGCLNHCRAFPFENYLQLIKRLVRSGKTPVAQVVKRLEERNTGKILETTKMISTRKPNNAFIILYMTAHVVK